ncbi:DUF6683 family protein [Deinococcus koreensis]|uniref:Uncharacterized protein n=1 Tax=Deinococcus koreensis TaxID=2054903 RepID=A0A2K3UZR4_9DEIO|nr:DUF6683 family protein [Deinococcus koreensis]PNY82024.1 hypothetical protein CVO96_12180 [Deinococcus koreensis]
MPRRLLTLTRLLALGLLLLPGVPASAQGGSPAQLSGSVFKLFGQVGGTPATPVSPTPASPTPVNLDALKFRPSAEVRQRAIAAFLNTVDEQSPEVGAEFQKVFASTDFFAGLEGQARALFGLSTSNLADTWALYWAYSWLLSQGRSDDPTRAQVAGLRAQMGALMLKLPEVRAYSEARRQEISDTLMLQLTLYSVLSEGWKDDPASLKEFGQGIARSSRTLGLDLNQVTLTPQGFVPRK